MERGADTARAELAALEAPLVTAMKERLELRPAIEWIEPFALPRRRDRLDIAQGLYGPFKWAGTEL